MAKKGKSRAFAHETRATDFDCGAPVYGFIPKLLTTTPAREDLTDRECTKIIGSLIGGLAQMATIEDLRNAVCWWANNDEAWQLIGAQAKAVKETINAATGDPAKFC
jgi:hypothetical protein